MYFKLIIYIGGLIERSLDGEVNYISSDKMDRSEPLTL